jgi:hypothetical protein
VGSLFDTNVYQRRNHTPLASMNLQSFIRDMVWNGTSDPAKNCLVLTASYRHDVASRIWYELEWTGEDGERQSTSAQDFGSLLWRAAEIEMKAREKIKREVNQSEEG